MARPGIEPRTSDLRVRWPTDCATRPGLFFITFRVLIYIQKQLRLTLEVALYCFYGLFWVGLTCVCSLECSYLLFLPLQIVVPRKGLNILTTCVFIVGIIAGSGFLALPKAIDNAGKTCVMAV